MCMHTLVSQAEQPCAELSHARQQINISSIPRCTHEHQVFLKLVRFYLDKGYQVKNQYVCQKTTIYFFFFFLFVLFFSVSSLTFPLFSLPLFPSLHHYSQSVLELRKWTVCLFLEAGKEGKPKVSYGERGSKERGGGMCGGDKSPFSLCLCSETADASEQHYWIQAQELKQGKTDWFRFQLQRKERIKGTPTAAVCYQVSVTCTSCKANMFCFSLELRAWSHF